METGKFMESNGNDMKNLIIKGCREMGVCVTESAADKLCAFSGLLLEKNKVMNLTAINDEKEVAVKHFLDSLSVMSAVDFQDGAKVVDIGTGAGFPGLPLLICKSDLSVLMLDSTRKKLQFVEDAMNELSIKNGRTLHARAEEAGRQDAYRAQFDFCLSRAVAAFPVLAKYCLPFVKPGGLFIAYKGPSYEDELKQADIKRLGGEIQNIKKIDLPFGDMSRYLIMTKKVRNFPGNIF